jgi:elongator complex protein 1
VRLDYCCAVLQQLTNPDLQVPPDQPEDEERCRSIERGAKLVTVMPSTYSLTLQMPRGNLETIYPRALVLASIRRNIEMKKYRKAFLACRSQRVDMNILHDHAPTVFLENVGLFVDQVKRVDYIDLFLSQLRLVMSLE